MRYAGIGSRETPDDVLNQMKQISRRLGAEGWELSSGGADGADSAFEEGCDSVQGPKLIYIPWNGFNGRRKHERGVVCGYSDEALEYASTLHPNWSACSSTVKGLHARNIYQILGVTLKDPVDLVICWTKGAKHIGGTRTAIELALSHNIPVFNLASEEQVTAMCDFIEPRLGR